MNATSLAFIIPGCHAPQRSSPPDTMLLRALSCRTPLPTRSFHSCSASIFTTSSPFYSLSLSLSSSSCLGQQSLHNFFHRRHSSHILNKSTAKHQHDARRFACTATAPIPPADALDLSSPSDDARTRNADKNAVAVVVGASRGIGLAVVQNLVTRWSGRIVATCRNVDDAGALSALWQFMPDRFSLLPMDVCDEESVCINFVSSCSLEAVFLNSFSYDFLPLCVLNCFDSYFLWAQVNLCSSCKKLKQ